MKTIIVLAGATLLGSCSAISGSTCGSEPAKEALTNLIQNNVSDAVHELLSTEGSLASYDRSKLAAALSKVTIDLQGIRTTQDDPDSTRQFCAAKISISFPQTLLGVIDEARRSGGLETRKEIANRAGLMATAAGLSDDIEYSVQPTDDGSETVAEVNGDRPLFGVLGNLFASYLKSNEIRLAKIEQDRIDAENAAAERATEEEQQRIADEASLAADTYSQALVDEAAAENKLAAQRLAAIWSAIPSESRKELAPVQTAWNRKTTARCKVEAAGNYIEAREIRAAQLRCESNALASRARELERFTSYTAEDSTF